MQNADFCTYWSHVMNEIPNIKNDDGTYKSDAFHKICNTFFNHIASAGCPVVAGDCLLHYMHSGKKKPATMSHQSFLTCFEKELHAMKLLDCCYEKERHNEDAKILFFYSFPKDHIQDCVYHSQCNLDDDTLEDLKNCFQGHYDANLPKKNDYKDVEVKRVKLSITTALVSHPGRTPIHQMWLLLQLFVAPLTNLVTSLAHVTGVMQISHMPLTNADSAKTAPSNETIVPCIILPLGHKQQNILTPCSNPPILLNRARLICLHGVLLHCNAVNMSLMLLTLPTANVALQNAVALAAALAFVHLAVIATTMTAAVVVLLVLDTIPILGIMTFCPPTRPSTIT